MLTTLRSRRFVAMLVVALAGLGLSSLPAEATHSWNGYHWARTANPFTLKLGDNVTSTWDAYLTTTSNDWTVSSVVDTPVVAGGTNPKRCGPTSGRVEVCNSKYGQTGWLGVAQVWAGSDNHITQGAVKLNDTYFNTAQYNTPAWRNLVSCQEVGHTLGLDHQDENFDPPNLGSCMDYTNNPAGPPSNEHPNQHDYDQLGLIYAHTDSSTTVGSSVASVGASQGADGGNSAAEWGRAIRYSRDGRPSLYERDLGQGQRVFTFVIWAHAGTR